MTYTITTFANHYAPSRILGFLFVCYLQVLSGSGSGQETAFDEAEYVRVTNERAQKIVSGLKLTDPRKELRVRDFIAKFYRDLHATDAKRDAALTRSNPTENNRETVDVLEALVQSAYEVEQFRLHYAFLGRLGTELNGDEIDKVKNGLTYEVAPKTLEQYLKLHPKLNLEQLRTIHALLLEAREYAMDAGSSEKKHSIFGKYKGRINNYLSSEGYDAKEAERDLKLRQSKQ